MSWVIIHPYRRRCIPRLRVHVSFEAQTRKIGDAVKKVLLALGFMACIGVPRAFAQTTQTFMLIPGIQGSSTDDGHANWVDVVSLTQTLDNGQKKPQCSLEVMKTLDVAGPLLWGAAVTGQVFGEIRIEVQRAGGDRVVFYQIKLQNAHVTSISTIGNGGYVERVTLDAGTVALIFRAQKPDGSFGGNVVSTFSC
jgi:type VI secretion system Hcp family effector